MTGKDDMSFQASELRRQAEEMALEKPALSLEEIHAMSTEEIQQMFHELRVHQIELEMQKEELRRAQAQVEAGRARYFDLYDQAPVGYCTLSEHGLIIEANLTAATLLGLSRSELATQPLSRFIHSDDQHIYSLHHKQLLETATLQKCDLRLVKPGGDYIWAHLKETVTRADDGAFLCRVVLSDISGRIQAEKQRETLAQKYAAVVSTTRDAVLAVNLDGRITVFNPGAEKLFGCTAEEALGSLVMRFCPEDLLKKQAEMMRRVLDTGAVTGYESERLTADGRRIPVEITVSRNTDDQGTPSGINAILRDITERKLVEDALRESMHFTNSIIRFAQDIIVFKDQNFIFRLVNPAFCKMIGKAQSEIIGKTDFDIFPYELAEKYRNDDKLILESGQSANFEETVSAYDGTRYVSTTKAPVLNDNNVCQGIVIIVRDITEHKRAEKALIESEALFRGMFEDHSAVMLLVDPNTGRIVLANQAAAQFYGFPLDNLLQMNIHQLNVLSPTEIAEKMAGAFNKQINIFEFQHKLADGQIRDVQVHSSPTTLQNQRLLLSIIHDITARKEADAKLQAFSRDFEAFLDQTTDFVYFKDLDSRIRFCSQTLASITGHRNWRDMVGKHDREIFPPDTAKIYEDEEEPVFSEGKPLLGKVDPYYDEKGEIGYVQTNKWPLFDADGRLVGIFGISRDITERKKGEAALKESEANFRLFFETVTDIMAVATPEGRILFTNQAARDKLGYSEDDLEGMHLLDWHQPEDRSEAERIFTAMIRGEQKHCPLPLAAKDGTLIPVETRVWFGQWSGQDCVFGICKDLSAQQEAQQRFERIFFTNPSPMALSSVPDRQLIEVNDAFLETIGYTREEVIGKSSVELGLIADPKAQNTVAEIMLAKRRIANYELQVLRKDGMLRDGLFSGEVIRSQGRECFLSVMIDITERKRAEEALREQRDFSESLIETAQAIILVLDAQGRIIRFNPYMEKLVGYALDEVKGKDWFETFLTPETSRTIKPFFEKAVNDIHTSGNVNPIIAKDGRRILVEWNDKTLKDKEGRTVGLLAIGQDITMRKQAETERKKLRAQLTQAQKAESLGRMAGAIAHIFNNQLGVVIGNLDMAIEDLPRDAKPITILTNAMQGALKAAQVSGLMLTYLGQTTGIQVPLDLSESCRRSLPLLRAKNPHGLLLKVNFPSHGPVVKANANQIEQMVAHLITNAREAIDNNQGTISLAVKTVCQTDISEVHRYPADWQAENPDYACLETTDNGCGIAKEAIDKIFDPFFSTKFTGRGLGLPVVLGIVRAHDGVITVATGDQGTTFRVFLPLSAGEIPQQLDKTAPISAREGSITVLLIEDEEMTRDMATTMIMRLGYTVLAAKDGFEAMEMFARHQNEIHCVVSDVTMPRMNGWETLASLRKLSPNIPVILCSGHDEAQVLIGDHPERPQAFLHKPYQMVELQAVLAEVMND